MKNKAIPTKEEISRLAFYKWQLSGKRAMNTLLFSALKKYDLTDNEFQSIIDMTNQKIIDFNKETETKESKLFEKESQSITIVGMVD